MSKSYITSVVIVFLLVGLIAVVFLGKTLFQPRIAISENKQVLPLTNWKTLSNKEVSLRYPSEAKGEARDNESLVTFMGQKQLDSGRTQTELFDGYSVRVERINVKTGETLAQTAQQELDNAKDNCQSESGLVSQLQTVNIDNHSGFQFSAKGCYIDYTETIIASDAIVYRISQSYVGDAEDQKKYQDVTDQILMSIRFADI